MHPLTKLLLLLDRISNSAKAGFFKLIDRGEPMCRIEEINTESQTIIVHIRGISSPLKFRFDEIIKDVVIISNLSSEQASWVGYYFGIYYKDYTHEEGHFNGINLSAGKPKWRYSLVSQDRQGKISYLDRLTNLTCTSSILCMLTRSSLINNFDPIEALYLGVRAMLESCVRH